MNKLIAFLIIVMLSVTAFFSFTFIVTQKEVALKLRLGAIHEGNLEPGLHFKWPFVDEIVLFDHRILVFQLEEEQYKTAGSEILDVSSFIQWRIIDAELFYQKTGSNLMRAENILKGRFNDSLRAEFGKLSLDDVISGKRDEMIKLSLDSAAPQVLETLGVEIVDLKIKTIHLQDDILDKVYERMISARQKVAQEDRSEGRKEQIEIQSEADREKVAIESNAYRDAEIIRGEGDAEAAKIYADAFSVDPEFYAFLRSLKAYEVSLGKKGDIMVLDQDDDFFRYLKSGNLIAQ
ncbi:protease modulator HflC [Marinicellulosiphila megalodicopiae]|uniref:protease modulator HflC n=1 Tax=Marinicellulosiphila megalodicopiae TaxID=2724896 RepID=UPI003BAFF21E